MTDPISVIKTFAPQYGLDPNAVLAYALTQGGTKWGAVGDNGSSFGPFQLHRGGALGSHDAAWANSPEGLQAAMGMMSRAGAKGLKGPDAAAYIVGPAFGRGANTARDQAAARAAYARATSLIGSTVPSTEPSATTYNPADPRAQRLSRFIGGGVPRQQRLSQFIDGGGNRAQRLSQFISGAPGQQPNAPIQQTRTVAGYAVAPGIDVKDVAAPVLSIARQFGLDVTSGFRSVAQQAALYANRSAPGSVGAPGKSWHNHGRAIDVAPNANGLAFLKYAFSHPSEFKEVFYDPAGISIKNGQIVHYTIGGHTDHIHIAR